MYSIYYYIIWTSILLMEYIITFHNSINIPYIIYLSIYNVLQKLWESHTLSHGDDPIESAEAIRPGGLCVFCPGSKTL